MRKGRVRLHIVVPGVLLLALLALGMALGVVAVASRADPTDAVLAREAANTRANQVADVTGLYRVPVRGIIVPHEVGQIIDAVRSHDHISIGGGRNSMGGQTASPRAVQLDMRQFNKVLAFSKQERQITVQAGATWHEVLQFIDPHGLSVQVMQSYANFTVGGSLSVNVHGRYVGAGPIINSVRSLRIVLADGSLVEASPASHAELFYGAIGGYGGLGVITDVTLALADNVNVERSRLKMPVADYQRYFLDRVRSNPDVIFHNGDLHPPHFESVSAVSWSRTDRQPTTSDRLIPRHADYHRERMAMVVASEWPFGRAIREHVLEPRFYASSPVHTRNYEASYDTLSLEPASRAQSTYVLQEYFVPVERFAEWIPKMRQVFRTHRVNVVNVSIRHTPADPGSLLAWARVESFAFVIYYKQGTDEASRQQVGTWTREMIDQALSLGGSYYLPYQPWASESQLRRAYPGLNAFFVLKQRLDPANKFTNSLWDRYYAPPGAANQHIGAGDFREASLR